LEPRSSITSIEERRIAADFDRLAESIRALPDNRVIALKDMLKKPFYTPAEVAELLQIHVETVRRAIRDGRLKSHRFGRQHRISTTDLQRFIDSERE